MKLTDGSEPTRGCWWPNPGPLQDQQMLFTAEWTISAAHNLLVENMWEEYCIYENNDSTGITKKNSELL